MLVPRETAKLCVAFSLKSGLGYVRLYVCKWSGFRGVIDRCETANWCAAFSLYVTLPGLCEPLM